MTEKIPAHAEMSIALPLDVVADKLMRIEEELRSLNMKTLSFEQERDSGELNGDRGRLERIEETLDSIRARVSDLQGMFSRPATASRALYRMNPRTRSSSSRGRLFHFLRIAQAAPRATGRLKEFIEAAASGIRRRGLRRQRSMYLPAVRVAAAAARSEST